MIILSIINISISRRLTKRFGQGSDDENDEEIIDSN
jgi:hypothetical protein